MQRKAVESVTCLINGVIRNPYPSADSAQGTNGTTYERGFRVPAIIRWPGRVKPGSVQNGLFSGLDWLPTPVDCAGNPNIAEQLLNGVTLGDRTYKNHLDGYDHRALLEAKDRLFDMSSSTSGVLSHWTVPSPDVS